MMASFKGKAPEIIHPAASLSPQRGSGHHQPFFIIRRGAPTQSPTTTVHHLLRPLCAWRGVLPLTDTSSLAVPAILARTKKRSEPIGSLPPLNKFTACLFFFFKSCI